MNFFELLSAIHHKAEALLLFVFTRDYSALEEEFFGVSALDFVALFLAAQILMEILRAFGRLAGSMMSAFGKVLFRYLSNIIMVLGRNILMRASVTVKFIWNLQKVVSYRTRLLARAQALFGKHFTAPFSNFKNRF